MAESLATIGIHVFSAAVDSYRRNGTAQGLHKQADKVLADARKNLFQDMDPEDIALIEESLENHPDLDSLEELRARYKHALLAHKHHQDKINHANLMQRAWAFSKLAQSIKSELEDVKELDRDIISTTACPARSVTDLLEIPKPKRQHRESKLRAYLRGLAKLSKSTRDTNSATASVNAESAVDCLTVPETDDGSVEFGEIREAFDRLSELVETGGDDFEQQVDEVLVQFSPRLPSFDLSPENVEMTQLKNAPILTFLAADVPAGMKVTYI